MRPTRIPATDHLIRRATIRRIATNLATHVASTTPDKDH